jgi:enoyl-CoA hydratase/carnithine racemase
LRRICLVAIPPNERPKPVIASVDGVATRADWSLALACDRVVASTRSRFSQIYALRGLSVDVGGSWLLPRVVFLQQAKRLTLLGNMFDAEDALRLGAVTRVKRPRKLAVLPPIALTQSKAFLNRDAAQPLRGAIESESRAQAVNYATEDFAAALRALVEKSGVPAYTGRQAGR